MVTPVPRRRAHHLLRYVGSLMLAVGLTAVAVPPAQAAPPAAAVVAQQRSGWSELPGGGATPDAPAVVSYNDFEYVFVRGTDSKIYVNLYNGAVWRGWREVPGAGATPSAPSAAVFNGSLYLFVQGTDSKIYVNRAGADFPA